MVVSTGLTIAVIGVDVGNDGVGGSHCGRGVVGGEWWWKRPVEVVLAVNVGGDALCAYGLPIRKWLLFEE